jgi:hypothetical protein
MIGISRTQPFRDFQRLAGISTFHVNTIAIGLELIARGGQKPEELKIAWSMPNNPRESIEQTKHFALLALMTHVVDGVDRLQRDYSEVWWFELPNSLRDILRKSVTKPGNIQWSIAERVEQLMLHLGEDTDESLCFLELMVSWRNAIVHTRNARFEVSGRTSSVLTQKQEPIAAKYANIDTLQALEHFRTRKFPTLKEATTMIAVIQNLTRRIDEALIHTYSGRDAQIERIARREIASALKMQHGGWKRVWGRDVAARRRSLSNYLNAAGIVGGTPDIKSAVLQLDFLNQLASMSTVDVEGLIRTECDE